MINDECCHLDGVFKHNIGPHNVTITLILCEYYNPQNASNFLNFRLNSKNFF